VGEPFEIQLRTLAMDSWATISHYLSYKKGWDIPDELQRDFHAVAALLYLADKHFDDVYRHVNKQKEAATSALSAGKPRLQRRISPYSVAAYLAWKFPSRNHVNDSSVGEFSQSLLSHGIRTLGVLDKLVDAGLPGTLEDEPKYLRREGATDEAYYWWDLAAARDAVRRANPEFESDETAEEMRAMRTAALVSLPIPMDVFQSLVASLEADPSVARTCDDGLERTRRFLSAVPGVDVDAMVEWLEDYGAYCDCEVLANVAALLNVG
jgi:hypothetical protein